VQFSLDEITAVNILGRRMADAVKLVQALGGGWNRSNIARTSGMLRQTSDELKVMHFRLLAVVSPRAEAALQGPQGKRTMGELEVRIANPVNSPRAAKPRLDARGGTRT
jgi:hypothetical protein